MTDERFYELLEQLRKNADEMMLPTNAGKLPQLQEFNASAWNELTLAGRDAEAATIFTREALNEIASIFSAAKNVATSQELPLFGSKAPDKNFSVN